MATWQYTTYLIRADLDFPNRVKPIIPAGNLSLDELEKLPFSTAEVETLLSPDMRFTESWGGCRSYKAAQDNEVLLTSEGSASTKVRIRFDLRTDYGFFAIKACALARALYAIFVTESSHLVEPDPKILTSCFLHSTAHEFLSDPVAFLEKLRREHHDS